jgi:hypothetical protein
MVGGGFDDDDDDEACDGGTSVEDDEVNDGDKIDKTRLTRRRLMKARSGRVMVVPDLNAVGLGEWDAMKKRGALFPFFVVLAEFRWFGWFG